MNCEKFEELILSMPDGELTQEERDTLTAHAAVCRHCREMYDTMLALSAELKAEPDFPPELHDELMSAVRRDKRAKKPSAVRLRRYLAAAACFAVVVAAAGTAIGGLFRCGSSAPSSNYSAAEYSSPEKSAPDNELFTSDSEEYILGEGAGDSADSTAEVHTDGVHAMSPPAPEPDMVPDIAEASLKSLTNDGEAETHLTAAEAQLFLTALFDGSLNEKDADYTLRITESGGGEYTLYLTLTGGVITMSLTPDDPAPIPVVSVSELTELINELK